MVVVFLVSVVSYVLVLVGGASSVLVGVSVVVALGVFASLAAVDVGCWCGWRCWRCCLATLE